MNYKAYRKAKMIESLILLLLSTFVIVFCGYFFGNPGDWGIAGIIIVIALLLIISLSIHIFILSLHSFVRILTYKQSIKKYAGYVTGAIAKSICFYTCIPTIIAGIDEADYLMMVIALIVGLIFLVSIITDIRLIVYIIRYRREEKIKLTVVSEQEVIE